MITKRSEAWQIFIQNYERLTSKDSAYQPSALAYPDARRAQILESMLETLWDIKMDNSVNRDLEKYFDECDNARVPSYGYVKDIIQAFKDRLLSHTKGNFIKKLETHLRKLNSYDVSYSPDQPNADLVDLSEVLSSRTPRPPYYLPAFYRACSHLISDTELIFHAIGILHREGII